MSARAVPDTKMKVAHTPIPARSLPKAHTFEAPRIPAQEQRSILPGHAFDRVPVYSSPIAAGNCPMSLASPRTCPFGGACHTCPARVQAKLVVNQPGDRYEQEADRVAEQVLSDGGSVSAPGDSPVQIQRVSPVVQTGVLDALQVGDVLNRPGKLLEPGVRRFMEGRFGQDFHHVRVHSDARAAESAREVNALAYTVGNNVVFGRGQYAPATAEGRRLIAHELTHVIQQASRSASGMKWDGGITGSSTLIQRQVLRPYSEIPSDVNPVRLQQLDELFSQITVQTATSIMLRTAIDALPPTSSLQRDHLESSLNQCRTNLIGLLGRRIEVLRIEILFLNTRIGPNPTSSAEHPHLSALGNELNRRERELRQHEQQLRPLRLWRARRELQAIPGQIDQINRDIRALPPLDPSRPASEMNDPRVQELMARRARLEERKRQLASTLTSSAIRFRQGDPRWGSQRYGTSPHCTNVAEAGCGPTSLAILLNYLFQDDPEAMAGGDLEMVRPPATVDYAATHGRICNNGTAGDTMVTNVHTRWPGFHGSRITLEQAIASLRNGNLVIFLCRNCVGQNSAGQDRSYGGHYMVLNEINADASSFNVIDPAGHNIIRISRTELRAHTAGFWTVVRK
ncbi:MAG: DUF4157 domain-containing protein [Chloroflexota bacterium]